MWDIKPPMPCPGSGPIFYEGKIHNAKWRLASQSEYETIVELENDEHIRVTDKDDRLGFIYAASDSGSELYNVIVLLKDDEKIPSALPEKNELILKMMTGIKPVMDSFLAGETCPEDVQFCRNIFSSPAAMFRTIQETGSVEAAQEKILTEIFRIKI